MSTLLPLDLVDLGLVRHFLGESVESIWEECVVALSVAATRIALARVSSLLLLQQRSPAGSAPTLLEMPRGDRICSLEWVECTMEDLGPGDKKLILLAGCASGSLRAFTPEGSALWSVRPRSAPLVSVHAHTQGPTPDVLLVFEDGSIGHASASWLAVVLSCDSDNSSNANKQRHRREVAAGIDLVHIEEKPPHCAVVLSCGPLPPLPLDVHKTVAEQPWCFIAAGRGWQEYRTHARCAYLCSLCFPCCSLKLDARLLSTLSEWAAYRREPFVSFPAS